MLRLSEEGEGIVRLELGDPPSDRDEADYIAALEAIALRRSPFALVVELSGGRKFSHEGERAQALWFKRTRAAMDATCRACAIVRPTPTAAMQNTFSRLWSFPVLVTADREEGLAFARRHLAAPEAGS